MIALLVCTFVTTARGQDVASTKASPPIESPSPSSAAATANAGAKPQAAEPAAVSSPTAAPALPIKVPDLLKRENAGSTLQLVVLLTVLSIVPAILLMVTSFARILIVLTLLRQALGAQQLP